MPLCTPTMAMLAVLVGSLVCVARRQLNANALAWFVLVVAVPMTLARHPACSKCVAT